MERVAYEFDAGHFRVTNKNETAERSEAGGLALLDKGPGIRGMGSLLIQYPHLQGKTLGPGGFATAFHTHKAWRVSQIATVLDLMA